MGCSSSTAAAAAAPHHVVARSRSSTNDRKADSALQDALRVALVAKCSTKEAQLHHLTSFNGVALGFPRMHDGLKQLRDKFTAWTGGIPSASIAWSTLSQQLPGLGFNMESQTIKGLADRLEGKQVTYDGLVIITMLCSVKEPQAIQGLPESVKSCMGSFWTAISHFGSASSGALSREEIVEAMQAGSRHKGKGSQRVVDRLLERLEWDKGGQTLQFTAFITGITHLVLEEYGDEEEEEKEDAHFGGKA